MKELCPNIYDFTRHWSSAPNVAQAFEALVLVDKADNDGVICASKAMVECACKTIVEELDDPSNPIKGWPNSPIKSADPTMGNWMAAATNLLNLVSDKTDAFNSVIGQYNELATKLGRFRNKAGTIAHGRMGFEQKLSAHHRRTALITADTVIGFLHDAYLSIQTDPTSSFEPYDRFPEANKAIDTSSAFLKVQIEEDGTLYGKISLGSNSEEHQFSVSVSEFLFGTDRFAYREAFLQAGGVHSKEKQS
ncbi:MAG: abortive infection family protein [Rhodobacteraceae bacterium]|nr:abortive infection family protein [Paracoccaceae bacterium]